MSKAISSERSKLGCAPDSRPRARARNSVFLPRAMNEHELNSVSEGGFRVVTYLTAKRLYTIAQGFSPGYLPPRPALKGRPKRVPCGRLAAVLTADKHRCKLPHSHVKCCRYKRPHSDALSGRVHWSSDPGLKLWAILFNRFAVI